MMKTTLWQEKSTNLQTQQAMEDPNDKQYFAARLWHL